MSAQSLRCRNHPLTIASWRCDACNAWFCDECVAKAGELAACVQCGRGCKSLAEPAVAARAKVSKPAPAPALIAMPPVDDDPPLKLKEEPPAQAYVPPVLPAPVRRVAPDVPRAECERPCEKHPAAAVTRRCEQCGRFFCPVCIKEDGSGLSCADCGAHLRRLTRNEQGLPPKDFLIELPLAFFYPFKGDSFWMLLFGGVLLFICPFGGTLGSIVGYGYCCAYLMSILLCSANGESQPPKLPSPTSFVHDILSPLFFFFVAWLVSFAPALLFAVFVLPKMATVSPGMSGDPQFQAEMQRIEKEQEAGSIDADERASRIEAAIERHDARVEQSRSSFLGLQGPATGITILIALLFAGLFYMPMCLIALGLYQTVSPLNPLFIVPSIKRVLPQYSIVFALICVAAAAEFAGRQYAMTVPVFGHLISRYLWLYFMMAEMRLLGVLYDANQDRLGWFT